MMKILYRFIEGQTRNGMPRGAKMNLALYETSRNKFLVIQMQAPSPRMYHHKRKGITDIVCKNIQWRRIAGHQLPTKTPIE